MNKTTNWDAAISLTVQQMKQIMREKKNVTLPPKVIVNERSGRLSKPDFRRTIENTNAYTLTEDSRKRH